MNPLIERILRFALSTSSHKVSTLNDNKEVKIAQDLILTPLGDCGMWVQNYEGDFMSGVFLGKKKERYILNIIPRTKSMRGEYGEYYKGYCTEYFMRFFHMISIGLCIEVCNNGAIHIMPYSDGMAHGPWLYIGLRGYRPYNKYTDKRGFYFINGERDDDGWEDYVQALENCKQFLGKDCHHIVVEYSYTCYRISEKPYRLLQPTF